jgi:hypothetical protein
VAGGTHALHSSVGLRDVWVDIQVYSVRVKKKMHLELLVVMGAQGNKVGVNVNLIKICLHMSTYIIYITQFLNVKFILYDKIMFRFENIKLYCR